MTATIMLKHYGGCCFARRKDIILLIYIYTNVYLLV